MALGVLGALAGAAGAAMRNDSTREAVRETAARAMPIETIVRNELVKSVPDAMRRWELESIENCEASVLGLYLHFFWSIFVLIECSIWFGLYGAFYIIICALYYLERLASCGKGCTKESDEGWNALFYGAGWMFYYYYRSWVFLLGNIIIPWMPPLYFYKRYDQVVYPQHKPKTTYLELTRKKRSYQSSGNDETDPLLCMLTCCCTICLDNDECCCSCTGVEDADVPAWMLVQQFFFTVGGFAACSYDEKDLHDRATQYYEANTMRFYRETYSEYGLIDSFEALVHAKVREMGGEPSAAPAPTPVPAPAPPAQQPTIVPAVNPPSAPAVATAVAVEIPIQEAEVVRSGGGGGSADKV